MTSLRIRVTRGGSISCLGLLFVLIVFNTNAFAQMAALSDDDLSSVYASGFSTFDVSSGVARADFQIKISTFTEIDSLKLGYYADGTTNDYGFGATGEGWDQDWTQVSIGTESNDLVCDGVYIEAKFSNISNPATRSLEYIKIGTPEMTGDVIADFNSFSGYINGTSYDRSNLGTKKITSTNSEFYLSIGQNDVADKTLPQEGIWVYFESAAISDYTRP